MRVTHLDRALLALSTADEACVFWTGHIDKKGYGKLGYRGRGGMLAHRVVYERSVGPIPDGLTLDHQCFVTACVNPRHLTPASLVANSKRQRSAAKEFCVNGHPRTPENSYFKPPTRPRQGLRHCRACNREAARAYKARKKGLTAA